MEKSGACGCAQAGSPASALCCCSQARLVQVIGRKYAMSILSRIGVGSNVRFADLERSLDISSSTLAQTLDNLTASGLVCRLVVPERPPRTEYSLTSAGRALLLRLRPLLDRIHSLT